MKKIKNEETEEEKTLYLNTKENSLKYHKNIWGSQQSREASYCKTNRGNRIPNK